MTHDAWSLFHRPQSIVFAINKCIDHFSRWRHSRRKPNHEKYTFALSLGLIARDINLASMMHCSLWNMHHWSNLFWNRYIPLLWFVAVDWVVPTGGFFIALPEIDASSFPHSFWHNFRLSWQGIPTVSHGQSIPNSHPWMKINRQDPSDAISWTKTRR